MVTIEELRAVPLLAELDATTLADMAVLTVRRSYRPGQHILLEGEPPHGLFFLVAGKVRLARTAQDGREQVLAMVGPGEDLSLTGMFDDQPNIASARAMSPVTCLVLPRQALRELLVRHPELAMAALRALSSRVRELVVLVEDLAFRSVRARLARHLLAEAAAGVIELTHQDLAERAGTVREIAGRALRRLAEEGLVRMERGRIQVLDREGLARVAQQG